MKSRFFVTLSMVLAGCASAPENGASERAIRATYTAVCTRLETCFPESFAATYPGGTGDCEAAAWTKAPRSACSDSTLDRCTSETRVQACPATPEMFTPAASCGGC